MKAGYYWVRFRGKVTIARKNADYEGDMSWDLVASDSIFYEKDFDVIFTPPIPPPNDVDLFEAS